MADLTSTSEVTYGVEQFYDRRMLMKAKPALIHGRYGQVRNIPRNNTDSIRFRRYTLLSAATTPLSEGKC